MKIEVTAEDIKNGLRARCKLCPVALAVARAFGQECWIRGGQAVLWKNETHPNRILSLPHEAHLWYSNYDRGKLSLPFSFELKESEL